MLIKEAIEQCKKSAYAIRAKATGDTYTYGLEAFVKYLKDNGIQLDDPVQYLKIDHFIFFPAWLAEREYTKMTMGVYVASIKFFLDQLVIMNLITPNYQQTLR